MAKRKRKGKVSGKRRTTSRRGLGAISGHLTTVLAVAGGAVAAGMINKIIPATVNDKIVAGGKILVGAFLPTLVKGQGRQIAEAAGLGMVAVGSVDLLKSAGILSGDFDIPVLSGDILSGDDLDQLNGDDDDSMSGNGDDDNAE